MPSLVATGRGRIVDELEGVPDESELLLQLALGAVGHQQDPASRDHVEARADGIRRGGPASGFLAHGVTERAGELAEGRFLATDEDDGGAAVREERVRGGAAASGAAAASVVTSVRKRIEWQGGVTNSPRRLIRASGRGVEPEGESECERCVLPAPAAQRAIRRGSNGFGRAAFANTG